MKAGAGAVVLLFLFCYVECRKAYVPIDKNANLAFINMEGGSGVRPGGNARPPSPTPAPAAPAGKPPATPITVQPPVAPAQQTTAKPAVAPPTPAKPAVAPPIPAKPAVIPSVPVKPTQPQIQPKPVNPAPASNPITTPGPGSVKQLINFYDSQGKASPIRPYSYTQAVKQG